MLTKTRHKKQQDVVTAKPCREISIRVFHDIGIMAQVTRFAAERGAALLAASAWTENENIGVIHLVTDDNLRVMDRLRAHHYAPEEISSIMVTMRHSPGMLSRLCEKIAYAGISIHYLYTSSPLDSGISVLILSTNNDDRALVLLNE